MPVKEPESMQELVYFTNRTLEEGKGNIKAWVYKKACPQCSKAKMGKPVDKGKVKIRAAEYRCPDCGFTEEKKAHEESLNLEAKYLCPSCGKEGESTAPYKRRSFMGVQAYVVECCNCGAKIPLTKKMKAVKK
ncbi:hypothetical protein KY366_03905 [Candidatus Woesearchaeota archaeon]|nr:hypothetical protein [Candidatus Woesearchaeota archaeon]